MNTLLKQQHIGAIPSRDGVNFRVWAPRRKTVSVLLEADADNARFEIPAEHALEAEGDGYFSGIVTDAKAGFLYRYRLDGQDNTHPDPASRFQPHGPHGPSQVVDAKSFAWSDHGWKGLEPNDQVTYEIHIGTFTPEGTWRAATAQLQELHDVGITTMQVLPVADFPGKFGWGYDGVDMYAPTRLYGSPDDFRTFVNTAHGLGMAVILDIVYNHLGPDGNYLKEFSDTYFSTKHSTDWGEALNYDADGSEPVRDFFIGNAVYWIEDFHLDGFRLDATQNIYDDGPRHILADLTEAVEKAANGRKVFIVAENEPQNTLIVRPRDYKNVVGKGIGATAVLNDDWHHSAIVALSGRKEAYYTDYNGSAQEFVSSAKYGYLYQGQYYEWQKGRRGTPSLDLPAEKFVHFLENHDQVANSGRGQRARRLTDEGRYRAMTALLLLGPQVPMLFQGQEYGATTPFYYFCDMKPDIAAKVQEGRLEFLAQFRSLRDNSMLKVFQDPTDPETFQKSKLDFGERKTNAALYQLHIDLLNLRREDAVIRHRPGGFDGAVLAPEAFILRYLGDDGDDRLLLVNLGGDLHLRPNPEPLLAPPVGKRWNVLWSSENPVYGGDGTDYPDRFNWRLSGHAAMLLSPKSPESQEAEDQKQLNSKTGN